jgi:hypothetical protein
MIFQNESSDWTERPMTASGRRTLSSPGIARSPSRSAGPPRAHAAFGILLGRKCKSLRCDTAKRKNRSHRIRASNGHRLLPPCTAACIVKGCPPRSAIGGGTADKLAGSVGPLVQTNSQVRRLRSPTSPSSLAYILARGRRQTRY